MTIKFPRTLSEAVYRRIVYPALRWLELREVLVRRTTKRREPGRVVITREWYRVGRQAGVPVVTLTEEYVRSGDDEADPADDWKGGAS